MSTEFDPDQNNKASTPTPLDDEAMWTLLSVYLDGEATPAEADLVEEMLRTDPAYAREFALMQRTAKATQSFEEVEPPADLRAAIYAATIHRPTLAGRINAARDRLRAAFTPRPARLAVAGGALAAAVLALALWTPGRKHHNATRQPSQIASLFPHPRFIEPPLAPAAPSRPAPPRSETPQRRSEPMVETERSSTMRLAVNIPDGESSNRSENGRISPPHTDNLVRNDLHSGSRRHLQQRPGSYERRSPDMIAYSPRPRMDQEYQRANPMMPASYVTPLDDRNNTVIADSTDSARRDVTPAPSVTSAVATSATPKVLVQVAKVPPLPPDTRHFLPVADIRREMEARNLGFNPATLEGIRRKEATITLIGTKF